MTCNNYIARNEIGMQVTYNVELANVRRHLEHLVKSGGGPYSIYLVTETLVETINPKKEEPESK